ncbi:hypothetical protein NIES22_37570 [Calothrix brevissima NIES-22]|nr:hypothetical protein NIES22_37570 [Calothrix brevissima NIES-22]
MTNIAKVVEKVIAEYSEEKKAEVTDWILKLGVRPDDPLFNLYAELGQYRCQNKSMKREGVS